MVSFYKPGKNKSAKRSHTAATLTIDTWDWKGQGVVRGKPVKFIAGALPHEACEVMLTRQKRDVAEGRVTRVLQAHENRQTPFCPVAGECGGCQLQHVDSETALSLRQQAIDDLLRKSLGRAAYETLSWSAPLTGPKPAYRRKARLAVDARNEHNIAIGYRAQRANRVIDIASCPVLVASLSELIAPLKEALSRHSAVRHIGHIGLLAGDAVSQVTIKVTRPLASAFTDALEEFARRHKINMLIESASGELITLHHQADLHCSVSGERYLTPGPNDFIQVNDAVNQAMVRQAVDWLAITKGELVADWFCGLGNFSLALADAGAKVQAIEGVAEMVQRAKTAAQRQGISNIDWRHLDLSDYETVRQALDGAVSKVLLDPSREGASVVCHALTENPVERILYVSCNPSTFCRDAATLTHAGYKMEKVSLVEMFPYTQHLEMMALFTHTTT